MGAQDNGLTLEGLAQRLETQTQRLETLERDNERMRSLSERISSENTELRDEVTALRGSGTRRDEVAGLRGSDTHRSGDGGRASEFAGRVSRGSLLSKAGAAAVAAVAAGTLLYPREAKAHTALNTIQAHQVFAHYLSAVTHGSDGIGPRPAVVGSVRGDANAPGVSGSNDSFGLGVKGVSASGAGVEGVGNPGVRGFSRADALDGTGVKGQGDTGVWGSSSRNGWSGVYGQHTGEGYGVVGDGNGPSYAGVLGRSPSGYGGRFEGGKAQLWLVPRDSAGPPTGAHAKGEIYLDSAAGLWVCVKGGPDSNWRKVTTTAA